MLIVMAIFTVVFLLRDVQILAIRDRATFTCFAGYAMLIVAAVAMMAGSGDAKPGILYAWTQRKFASVALAVQLAELATGFALRRFALGRYSSESLHCHGCNRRLAGRHGHLARSGGGIVMVLNWIDNPWEDRKFANDFALMTSCTALIFLPFSLS